ncbi:Hypp1967 [Branchiostoma lanceolatum]|uniref:Hypp1967 protein n=1 Tax=Branchiostoma lanceolatum TaxID=7740 RepID=A0A8J9ZMC0_BRALA|nr:Hypp1967 [Branchiostoma lanceolatum]
MSAADGLRRAPRRRNALGNILEGIDANVLQNLRQEYGERAEEEHRVDPAVLPAAEESDLPTSPLLLRRRNAVPDVRVGVERAELRRLRELYGVSWRPNGLFFSNAVF